MIVSGSRDLHQWKSLITHVWVTDGMQSMVAI